MLNEQIQITSENIRIIVMDFTACIVDNAPKLENYWKSYTPPEGHSNDRYEYAMESAWKLHAIMTHAEYDMGVLLILCHEISCGHFEWAFNEHVREGMKLGDAARNVLKAYTPQGKEGRDLIVELYADPRYETIVKSRNIDR